MQHTDKQSYTRIILTGRYEGIMDLEVCATLFDLLLGHPEDWYVYDLDKEAPSQVHSAQEFSVALREIKAIIDEKHTKRYCGIVYTDSVHAPTIIKVFHPDNVGKTCGSSEIPPLPKWIISKLKPQTIETPKPKKSAFKNFFGL